MKRAVFEKDFIRVEDSETGTPGAFLKFAFRVQAALPVCACKAAG